MTLTTALSLFGAMLILAALPGPGTLVVVSRTVTGGLHHGLVTAAGIVTGDYVFITFALLGLVALADVLGPVFDILRYAGAGYLIWLGMSLALSNAQTRTPKTTKASSVLISFSAGLTITLGNPKAILFYLSFFPAFINLSSITLADAGLIYAIATITVGGVMCAYSFAAHTMRSTSIPVKNTRYFRWGAGLILMCSGVYIAFKQ